MKRTSLMCLLSAALGALAATAYHETANRWYAHGQEPVVRQPARNPLELTPPPTTSRRSLLGAAEAAAGGAVPPSLDEFAPEERTNILVYEKANRSVVHITTKSSQRELLFLEVAEGSGSGSVLDKNGHILTNYHV